MDFIQDNQADDCLNIENTIENIESAIREYIHISSLEKVVYDDNRLQIQRLTNENSDLEETLKVTNESYNHSRRELEQLKQENAHLNRISEDRIYQLDVLRTELSDTMEANAQLRMELARSQAHVEKLNHSLAEYKDGIQTLRAQVEQGNQEARRRMQLEQELHRHRLESNRERMELERKLEDMMLSAVNVSAVAQQKESLRVQCDSLATQLQQAKIHQRESQQEAVELKKQLQTLRSRLAERDREVVHAQELLQTASKVSATLCANCGSDTNDATSKLLKTREVLQRQLADAMGMIKRMDIITAQCSQCGPALKRKPAQGASANASASPIRAPPSSNRAAIGQRLPVQASANTQIPHSVFLSPKGPDIVVTNDVEIRDEPTVATTVMGLTDLCAADDESNDRSNASANPADNGTKASINLTRSGINAIGANITSRYSKMSIMDKDSTDEPPQKRRRALSSRNNDDD